MFHVQIVYGETLRYILYWLVEIEPAWDFFTMLDKSSALVHQKS